MNRKGIILAGGKGTRLYPLTKSVSKQLLPVYDKPMIYYPLSTLMLSGIRDILIVTSPEELSRYKILLGDGSNFGINLQYTIQEKPIGLAHAFILGKKFINNSPSTLILGDNIFYGNDISIALLNASKYINGATIFGYHVNNPKNYGVVNICKNQKILSIEEKPKNPKSNYAVTGLYFYDKDVVDFAHDLKPSDRGELEITDINNIYLKKKKLRLEIFKRGYAWLDAGNPESLLEASQFVQTMEKRQGLKIACLEEIALKKNWISETDLEKTIVSLNNDNYKSYLINLLNKIE